MIAVGLRRMRESIHAKSMSDVLMSTEAARAHLSGFLAFASYRSRKWIVDSKWHLPQFINAFEISRVEGDS